MNSTQNDKNLAKRVLLLGFIFIACTNLAIAFNTSVVMEIFTYLFPSGEDGVIRWTQISRGLGIVHGVVTLVLCILCCGKPANKWALLQYLLICISLPSLIGFVSFYFLNHMGPI